MVVFGSGEALQLLLQAGFYAWYAFLFQGLGLVEQFPDSLHGGAEEDFELCALASAEVLEPFEGLCGGVGDGAGFGLCLGLVGLLGLEGIGQAQQGGVPVLRLGYVQLCSHLLHFRLICLEDGYVEVGGGHCAVVLGADAALGLAALEPGSEQWTECYLQLAVQAWHAYAEVELLGVEGAQLDGEFLVPGRGFGAAEPRHGIYHSELIYNVQAKPRVRR